MSKSKVVDLISKQDKELILTAGITSWELVKKYCEGSDRGRALDDVNAMAETLYAVSYNDIVKALQPSDAEYTIIRIRNGDSYTVRITFTRTRNGSVVVGYEQMKNLSDLFDTRDINLNYQANVGPWSEVTPGEDSELIIYINGCKYL